MSANALTLEATPRSARACSRRLRSAREPARPMRATREREAGWIGMAVTAAVHAALLAWLLGLRTPAPPAAPTPPAAAVVLELSLLPKAPPTPARDLPPGPPQAEREASRARDARPAAQPTSLPPRPQGEIASAPAAAPHSAPTPAPVRDSAPREPAAPAQDRSAASAAAPPDVAAAPAPRYAAARDAAGAGREIPRQWQQLLLGHLERFKRYPRQARRQHQEGVAQVRLSVAGDGRVLAARIETSSGHPLLDAEALAVAERASPVPAPPPELGEPAQVIVPMEFYIAL
ncbi:energy transducer TonB family protein [Lysobacter enzymogenes]|uniref:energy transducer TonB family protein n=1 Tax=Lysobacter enzymogenes TaxID=69 RepID=UPI0009F71DC1|nr:energy transducer TonB [Lysobacter enzymogenes]